MEWYFFSPRDRKYPNGSRTNRATEAGYWKATGRDRKVYSQASTVGIKKTLVFYRSRAPQGERTDWIMHEYRLVENECEAGPCLQNAFVLCRVFKKSGLVTKSGERYMAPLEKGDLSPTMKNPSPGYSGDMEVQSEDPSKPVEGIDANLHLPSKTSSKILHDTTGDSAQLNKWLDILLDDTIPNSSCVAADEDTIHTQVDAIMPDTPRMQSESASLPSVESELGDIPVNINFPQYRVSNGRLDAYFEEERMLEELSSVVSQDYTNSKAYHTSLGDTCADILNGGYIKVKNLIPSMGELENHDSCLWEVPYPSFDCEGTGIQLCCGSLLQSHKQGFSFEGTAARGVCTQLHKAEDSSERTEKDVTVIHSQNMRNDSYDCGPEMQQLHFDQFAGKKWDSENIGETEDSVPEDFPTYMAGQIDGLSFQKHDQVVEAANSAAFVYNSVDDDKSFVISHNLTSMPLYLSSYGLFVNEEPSEIIEVPTNIFQTTMKDETNCVNDFESLFRDLTTSSSPGNSRPAMSMVNKMSSPKTSDQTLSERYLLDSNKPASIDHVQKSENSAFKNDVGILTQSACLGKDLLPEKGLHNSGTSLEHGPQMQELELNSSEKMVVRLHIEDPKPSKSLSKFLSCVPPYPGSAMECNANLNPAKGILDSNVATNSELVCVATTNGHMLLLHHQ